MQVLEFDVVKAALWAHIGLQIWAWNYGNGFLDSSAIWGLLLKSIALNVVEVLALAIVLLTPRKPYRRAIVEPYSYIRSKCN